LSLTAIERAIPRLASRIADIDALDLSSVRGSDPELYALRIRIDETLADVFGHNSCQYWFYRPSSSEWYRDPDRAIRITRSGLQALIEALKERAGTLDQDETAQALSAFEGLALHPEIERAAGQLYRDGHYAHAVEDACKALNLLVKLRSGRDDLDGKGLMTTVFSKNQPILRFNDLKDQSDLDEQEGMMHLFAGPWRAFATQGLTSLSRTIPNERLSALRS
jgi:uncharacterized protein (TIGR02391 family)